VDLSFLSENNKILVELLSAAIGKRTFYPDSHADIDWPGVLSDAEKHQVLPLLYPLLSEIGLNMGLSGNILEGLRVTSLYDGKEEERKFFEMGKVLGCLSDANIPVIVLKGLIIRDLYPYPYLRTMSDADLLVRPEDMERAGNVLEGMGYKKGPIIEKHTDYSHTTLPHIELHRRLLAEIQSSYGGDFEEAVWSRAATVHIGGIEVLSLCQRDKALYLLLHMASHIISSGFGLRQLCDLVLVLEANQDVINLDELLKTASTLHIEVFAKSIFRICSLLFDLRLPQNIRSILAEDDLSDKSLMTVIFEGGVYGRNNSEDFAINRMIFYSGGQNPDADKLKFRYIRKIFFPVVDKLDIRYQYAKEHRWLLPVAWIHRLFYSLLRKDLDLSFKSAVFKSIAPTENYKKRVALLKRLGLLD
jgi:hypothetical protein